MTTAHGSERPAWWAFGWWVLAGALAGIGVAGALTVGAVLLALALVLTVVGVLVPRLRNRSALGVVGGLALAPLYIAWLNRGGPGQVCTVPATETRAWRRGAPGRSWPSVSR